MEYHIPFLIHARGTIPHSSSIYPFSYTKSEPGIALRNRTALLPNHSCKVSCLATLPLSITHCCPRLRSDRDWATISASFFLRGLLDTNTFPEEIEANWWSRFTELGSKLTCAVFTSPIKLVTISMSYRISALHIHICHRLAALGCSLNLQILPPLQMVTPSEHKSILLLWSEEHRSTHNYFG